MRLLCRAAFFAALLSITVLAFLPDYSALPEVVSYSDLANHAAAFAVLAVLYALSYHHTPGRIVLALLSYGIFIEAVQALLPTRYASVEDIAADMVGVVLGVGTIELLKRKKGTAQEGQES